MNITAQSVHERISQHLHPTFLEVMDESAQHAGHSGSNGRDEGTHFRVRIAGAQFQGISRVARHRLVYDAVQDFIDQGLPAFAIEVIENTRK